jgi:hypothetical protein
VFLVLLINIKVRSLRLSNLTTRIPLQVDTMRTKSRKSPSNDIFSRAFDDICIRKQSINPKEKSAMIGLTGNCLPYRRDHTNNGVLRWGKKKKRPPLLHLFQGWDDSVSPHSYLYLTLNAGAVRRRTAVRTSDLLGPFFVQSN